MAKKINKKIKITQELLNKLEQKGYLNEL